MKNVHQHHSREPKGGKSVDALDLTVKLVSLAAGIAYLVAFFTGHAGAM